MNSHLINTDHDYLFGIITSYNSVALRNKSSYEVILEGLKIFTKLTGCSSVTMFSLDPDSSEFYYRTSTALQFEQTHRNVYTRLVESGAVAEALNKSGIVESPMEVYELEGKFCLIIPLIVSSGIIGLIILTMQDSIKDQTAVMNYCWLHANNFALINHTNALVYDLQQLRESTEQKIAYRTNDIARSTRELKKILDTINTGIIIVDETTRQITDANTMALDYIGIKKENLIAQKIDDFFFSINGKKLTSDFLFNGEGLLKKNNGTLVPILRNENKISLSGSNYLMESFIDISEHKATEELLKTSEHKFRTVADYTFDWEYWEDENNQIHYTSPSCYRITGYTPDEFMDNYDLLDEIVHPDDKELYRSHHSKVFKPEFIDEMDELEFKIIKKNGSIAFINHICRPIYDENNNYLGRRISNRDITERKFVEREYRENEEKYKKLTETASDAIISVDSSGNIISWNGSAEKMFGYNLDEVKGRNIKLIIPDTYKLSQLDEKDEPASGHESWVLGKVINIQGLKKDQRIFPIELSLSSWESDEAIFYTVIVRDISERVKVEQELETYRNNLEDLVKARTEELDKVNELLRIEIEREKDLKLMIQQSLEKEKELNDLKSRFLSITSHEFRTPLASVLSSAELIEKYGKIWEEEKLEGQFARIKESVRYLVDLLDEVLTISSAEKGKITLNPTRVNLKSLLAGYIEDAKILVRNHHVNLKYETNKTDYFLDAKLMKFMISNLLTNAIKYSPKGGNIDIKVSSQNANLIIEVSDEGIGIPAAEINSIYQSFYRTKNAEGFSGTGLGLSIVKLAVDLHYGIITAKSVEGKGTSFTIKLPINVI